MDGSSSSARCDAATVRAPQSRNILDFIFFLRPMLHLPVWTILILGYFRGPVSSSPAYYLLWLLLLSSGAAGWANAVNQIADVESDRRNRKLYFLPLGLMTKKTALVAAGLIGAATIAGAFFFSLTMGIVFTLGLAIGYAYSGPPFRGENHPAAGTLLNGIGHGSLVYIAGYLGAGGHLEQGILLSLPYLFAVIAVFIGATLPDIPGDVDVGKKTPGAALGIKYSTIVMTLSVMASILVALVVWDPLFFIAADLSLPFYLFAAIKSDVRKSTLAIKLSILLLSVAACLRFWPYAIMLVFLFVITRIYYRTRFDMAYPVLS